MSVETYYASGHCAVGAHGRCRGLYSGVTCQCACGHQPFEPEPPGLRIGSLFSGYGGLEQGVQGVLGGTVAWHSDIDPGACKILAHRYPDVPNLGDITTVDWSAVEPVDVLTGGFPCQDVSCAGLRKGLRPDTRSGLWTQMAYAIDQLRPALVVAENVRGLLSAEAHSDLEPCPWCVGDGSSGLLRALGAVLGDLADIGYDASWQGLRAADVGAPHGRFRVFVVAWPASDANGIRGDGGRRARHGRPGPADGAVPAAHPEGQRWREGWAQPAGLLRRSDDVLCGASTAPDTGRDRREECQERHQRTTGGLAASQRDDADGRASAAADTEDEREQGQPQRAHPSALVSASTGAGVGDRPGGTAQGARGLDGVAGLEWGPYAAAVHRWERLTRPAPAPTEPGGSGMGRIREFADREHIDGYTARAMLRAGKWGERLSPAFVEWMQGLPAGWVTDVPGLTRNEQLKALGNGVVPQQAEAALRLLLANQMEEAA